MQTINNLQANSTLSTPRKQKWSVSIALNFRKKRFAFFKTLIACLPRPLYILDVGGTSDFWKNMGFAGDDLQLTLLNTEPVEVTFPNVTSVIGDARNMREFKDKEFEVVFSKARIYKERFWGLTKSFILYKEW